MDFSTEVGRRSTLTEADIRADTSRVVADTEAEQTENHALQLTGAARRVSSERIRDRDSESASTKRKRLKRARLNHSESSQQSVQSSTDFCVLDGPSKQYGSSPRRTLSQDSHTYRQLSLGQYSPRKEFSRTQLSFDSARTMDNHSPNRQHMVYEPRVIVTSGRPSTGDVILRRSSSHHHRRVHAQPSIDYDTLVQPLHSPRGK